MHIATHSVKAYAASRNLSPLEAFRELYSGYTYGQANHPIFPSDGRRIQADVEVYTRKGIIPHYVLKQLEYVRREQMQFFARASPELSVEPLFI